MEPDIPNNTPSKTDVTKKVASAATVGAAFGSVGIPFLPEGTPWYGYLGLYFITMGLPAILSYLGATRS